MPETWVPDIVIGAEHFLFKRSTPFLNGQQIENVMEARIKRESLNGEAFGELIVLAPFPDGLEGCEWVEETENGSTTSHSLQTAVARRPRLGEFVYGDARVWCKLVCGRVRLELGTETLTWPKSQAGQQVPLVTDSFANDPRF